MGSLAVVIWIVCGLATYLIARDRGFENGVAWFITGIVLGPFGILVAFVVTPPQQLVETPRRQGGRPRCPSCGRPNPGDAVTCAGCGVAL